MPRNNKITEKVFAAIAETGRQKGSYEKFLSIDQEMGLQESLTIKMLKLRYTEVLQNCVEDIKILAALEEIITQIRAKEVINSELRLSLSRDYIYARTTFYRRDNQINDIRVVVGKTEEYGSNLNKLYKNKKFKTICIEKLTDAMNKEIEFNLNNLNIVYSL